jgi:hypothetical protein
MKGSLYIARSQRTPYNPSFLLFSSFRSTSMICKIFKGLIRNTDILFSNQFPYSRLLDPLSPAPKVRSRGGES